MAKSIVILIAVLSSVSSFAKSASECAATAKGAAEGFMGEQMDEACAHARATVKSQSVESGKIIYQLDVVCGPASNPENHFDHQVTLKASDCSVIHGGPGDA